MSEIKGRRALVTGAAMGMGKRLAERLADEGASLALVDRDGPGLERVAETLKGRVAVETFVCDLSQRAQVDDLVKRAGEVDILVNNAGVVTGGRYEEIAPERDRLMLDVNMGALHWLTKGFLGGMKQRGAGHIVQLASAAGFLGVPEQALYCASKWFVIGLSEALRVELEQEGHHGVKLTIVCPGYVDTGMFEGVTPPRLMPLLEPDFVVERIVEAVKHDRLYVREPFLVKTTSVLRALLPRVVFDRVADVLGVTKSMHTWKGH